MDFAELVGFVRERGLAVVATRTPTGAPEAALVGVAITDEAEIVFDTSIRSRKYHNLSQEPEVALVVGFEDEVTVQCEGIADVPAGAERERCLDAYLRQYPDGRARAADPAIVHVRVRPRWVRISDYRTGSERVEECRR